MSNPKKLIKFTGKCPSCHIQVEDKGVCPGCGAQFRADGTFAFKSRHKKGDVNDGAAKAAEKPQKAVTAEPQKPQPEPQKAATPPDGEAAKAATKAADSGPGAAKSRTGKPGFIKWLWND